MEATSPGQAGIYVRISQDREGSGLGVQRQEEDCRKLAKQLGWSVHDVYVENDTSAYSGKKRPKYEALLADIEAGRVTGVVAWHPDRLHRSPVELERYIALSEAHGVETQTTQAGRWDLSTPSGRMIARQLGAVARYESEHRGERIKRARQQQAKAGGWHGGIRPFGFEADGVTVRDGEAVEIVKATEAIVTGESLRSIVRGMNDRGVATVMRRGPWSSLALKDVVMRPRNAGLSSYKGEIVGKAVWPALVPEETWRAACAILSDPARRKNQRSGLVRWLGSGLYVCGVCDAPQLRVGAAGNKRACYRCANRNIRQGTGHVTRDAASLDRYVESQIVERLSDPRLLAKLRETPDDDPGVASLLVEQVALTQRLDELAEMFAMGAVSASQLATASAKLRQRSDEIANSLSRAGSRSPLDTFTGTTDISDIWYGPAGPDGDRTGGLSLSARRAILSVVATVTVLPAPQHGRRRQPDGSFLDRRFVRIEWH